jgi:hypothetical protein
VWKSRIGFAFLLGLLLLPACRQSAPVEGVSETLTETPATAVPGALFVDTAVTLGAINPFVYGTNYGPWTAVPPNALDDFQQSGLTFIRFPGGNWGDENGIRANHLDMLKLMMEMVDASVTISVNLREGTPEQAVELMRMAAEKEIEVAYWSIGNEPNLYAGHLNEERWDTAYYNARWREFAEAMRAEDPGILLVGPNLSQYAAVDEQNPKDEHGRDWMRDFLRANGDLVDNVAIHRYPFGANATIEGLRRDSPKWEAIIPHLRDVIRE